MIDVTIDDHELRRLERQWRAFSDQVPFATANALNTTGFALRKVLMADLPASLDRPVPNLAKSMAVEKATKKHLVAVVGPMPRRASASLKRVLQPHLGQAQRPMRTTEKQLGGYTVPLRGLRLDRYGNPRVPDVAAIADAIKATDGRAGGRVFFQRGSTIYERRNNGSIKPVLAMLDEAPAYGTKLEWQVLADKTVTAEFPHAFNEAMTRAVATAKKRK